MNDLIVDTKETKLNCMMMMSGFRLSMKLPDRRGSSKKRAGPSSRQMLCFSEADYTSSVVKLNGPVLWCLSPAQAFIKVDPISPELSRLYKHGDSGHDL